MASENRGLHAALIVLFILVLLLSVATFMFFKETQVAKSMSKKDKETAAAAQVNERKMQEDFNRLLVIIGLSDTDNKDAAEKLFEEDKATYLKGFDETKLFYHPAIEELSNTLKTTQADLAKLQDELVVERKKAADFETASKQQVTVADEARKKAEQELTQVKARAATVESNAQSEIKNAVDASKRTQEDKAADVDRLTKDIAQLKATIAGLEKKLDAAGVALNAYVPKPTDLYDGEIRTVDQRNRLVYINRGSTDNLRRGMTFSVHSPDLQPNRPDPDDSKKMINTGKASIEVLDIIDGHLASCRILGDDIKNPILPGDKIYSVLWDPGQEEHYAVAGRVDLDGDGSDDHERVLNLIRANGGVVDMSIDDDGRVTGAMTPRTRYLIRGSDPKQTAMPAYTKAQAEAKLLGVQIIPGDRFIDDIGWKSDNSIVRFGTNSNVDTMPMPAPDGGLPVNRNTLPNFFKKRLPPALPNSAYDPTAPSPADAAAPM